MSGEGQERDGPADGAAEGGVLALEVACYARASLQVIALLSDLSFSSSTYTRKGRSGEFRLCGDPATLDAAATRLSATPFAVCVFEEVVDNLEDGD